PAADFEALLVRPSKRVLDAALAARDPVWRLGVPVCESALPPAVFERAPVILFVSVFDALLAALGCVVRRFFIVNPQFCCAFLLTTEASRRFLTSQGLSFSRFPSCPEVLPESLKHPAAKCQRRQFRLSAVCEPLSSDI